MKNQREKAKVFAFLMVLVLLLSLFLTSCGTNDSEGSSAEKAATADDLKNAKISVVLGSNEASLLTKYYPDAQVMEFNSATDALEALRTKKVDYFVIQNSILDICERNTNDVKNAHCELFASDNGFGFKKGRTDNLIEEINGKIKEYQENGRLDEMASHWADVNNYTVVDVPKNTTGKTIVVGTTGELEPLNFYMNNELVGLDIEIVGNILYDLGYQVEYRCMAFGALIPALESGKIDVLASSMDITEERLKRIDCSDPYFCEYISFAELKDDVFDDSVLNGSKVAVRIGSYESIWLTEHYPEATILEYNTIADALEALRSHKADYFSTYDLMLDVYINQIDDVKNLHCQIAPVESGFAFKKGNDKLREEVNSRLREYKENGRLDEMLSHWSDVGNYVVEEVPQNTTGETIIVGTTGEIEPFNFYINNELVGIDMEVIGNILYDLGYQVEYKCMNFAAIMPALESGKVDIMASGVSITEERKKTVDFSDAYSTDYVSLAVRDENATGGSFLTELKEGLYDNLVKEARYKMILNGLGMTVALTLATALFGTLLGILLCLMKRSRFRVLRGIKNVYSTIIEGIPMVVILMIVCYVILGKVDISGVIIGMIAFGMVFGNEVCGAIENGLNNVEPGQYEAMSALGFPDALGFRTIILPQLMRNILPIYRASFTSMIKATAIAGYVAIQDLTKAGDIIRSRTFDAFIPLLIVAAIYFVIIWIVTLSLKWIEKSGDRKRRKREVKL